MIINNNLWIKIFKLEIQVKRVRSFTSINLLAIKKSILFVIIS